MKTIDRISNLLETIKEKKMREVLPLTIALFALYQNAVLLPIHRITLKEETAKSYGIGMEKGIELTNAIYKISGSNEPLRYSTKAGEK